MKLCTQCQFIYEDDQERCDMDGAELIYEPTLEHVFPGKAFETTAESQRPEAFSLLIPLTTAPLSENSPASSALNTSKRVVWQIAAVVLIAVVAFLGLYAVRSAGRFKAQPSTSVVETQPSKSLLEPVVSAAAIADDPAAKLAKPEPSPSPGKVETKNAASEPAFPPLPGLKPLPRLKPLPTLKPIPRLADQNASMNRNRKSGVETAKPKAEPKKESRLGSFLKKTGRVLTNRLSRDEANSKQQ